SALTARRPRQLGAAENNFAVGTRAFKAASRSPLMSIEVFASAGCARLFLLQPASDQSTDDAADDWRDPEQPKQPKRHAAAETGGRRPARPGHPRNSAPG